MVGSGVVAQTPRRGQAGPGAARASWGARSWILKPRCRTASGITTRKGEGDGRVGVMSVIKYSVQDPAFVIVSTGRAGSKYTATLLTAAGVPCGHERFFTPSGYRRWPRWQYRGDSSWLAVPYLERWSAARPVVVHQTRHPLAVIRSLVGIGFFGGEETPFKRFAWAHLPPSGDPTRDAMRWYVEWNRRCEALADVTYPAESVHDHLDSIARTIGVRLSTSADELRRAPPTHGQNARARADLTMAELPAGSDKDAVIQIARRYGYVDV